jgi:hypothetical protein
MQSEIGSDPKVRIIAHIKYLDEYWMRFLVTRHQTGMTLPSTPQGVTNFFDIVLLAELLS